VVKGDIRGEKLVLAADEAYLPDRGFNDRASSLKVTATCGTAGVSFAQLAAIDVPGGTGFVAGEDLAVGDLVETGGTAFLELLYADFHYHFYVYQYDPATGAISEVKTFATETVFGSGVSFWGATYGNDEIHADRIACGDFYDRSTSALNTDESPAGDYKDEIIFMDHPNNIYIADPRSTASNKVVSQFAYTTEMGDGLAVGNLGGGLLGREFAVAHRADYLRIRYPDNTLVQGDRTRDFEIGDQFTAGELDGDNQSELIYLIHGTAFDPVGEIQIVDPDTSGDLATYGPSVDINPWDAIAAGDVNGDGVDEIIWGAQDGGDVYVIAWDGTSGGFSEIGTIANVFARYDRIVAGDINDDGIAEIIHGRTGDGKVIIYPTQ
jgi:hypothetical protein